MGTLRYAGTPYTVGNAELATLSHAASVALAGGHTFGVELQRPEFVVQLIFAPGVPLAFEIDDDDPSHLGGDVVDRWTEIAVNSGWIEILD